MATIERLRVTLRSLRALSAEELESPESESLRRDCADALRLELDCRQLELGASARDVLEHLSDLLESRQAAGVKLAAALRSAQAIVDAGASGPVS